jgi:signal transduction histidine kinase
MKRNTLNALSSRYLTALQAHFEQASAADDGKAAQKLGTQAVALGMETLDLAKIHDLALAALIAPDCPPALRDDLVARAAIFFTEASAPIEKTHRGARKVSADLNHLKATLTRQTRDLADSKRDLRQGIARRKAAGQALKTSGKNAARLLVESHQLQKHLQEMAHRILSAQEDERRTMSLTLQDEIAQTLVAIQIRLLALKKEVSSSNEDFKKEIANTRRLVESSVSIINRFASELGLPHEN